VKIRKATPHDIEGILKLKLRLKSQDIKTDPYLRPIDEVRDVYKKYLIHDLKMREIDRIVLVAVEDRKIIAYIRGTLTKTLHVLNVKLRGVIDNLYVEEKYRRKGVAKNLIEELMKWFKGKNVDVMTVHVYPLNSKAIALYKKLGFKEYSLNMNRRL
jgi:ribosomal protein S18 acetylase RimI-like enzyme